jgi:UDPglucose 6-dehydrogenase
MAKQRISVIGVGYVGLSTAIVFASKGYSVIASDKDPNKVGKIQSGIPPFIEPGLQELLRKSLKNRNFKCLLDQTETAVLESDMTFIIVGTPSRPDGSVEQKSLESAVAEIGSTLRKKERYHLVVVRSTVTPGTTRKVVKPILEETSGKQVGVEFGLCMNPEFLREGTALHDTQHPDRIVIGEYDKKSGDILESFYQEFFAKNTTPIIRTNLTTAEMIKYANNAFLAAKISYINTIANICEKTPGTDVTTVAKGMGLDKRISPHFLKSGLGYGGSCLPKDIKALIAFSHGLGYKPALLDAVRHVNQAQPYKAIELCKTLLHNLENKNISILGIAFKPNTDDMREAVSIPIINQLLRESANVTVYDPAAIPNAKLIFKNKIKYATSAIACIKNADCCIIVTEWDEFKKLKPEDFKRQMKQPILIDGRRIYNPETLRERLKFAAIGIGQQDYC